MATSQRRLTNLPVAAMGLAAAGLGAAAMSLGNGDAVVERGFKHALANMGERSDLAKHAGPAIAGSEQFWLTHVVHDAGTTPTRPVSVGDNITISSGAGERVLDVVEVQELDSSFILASSERPTPLLLVTCRDRLNPSSRPVRLLLDADGTLPALSARKTARAL